MSRLSKRNREIARIVGKRTQEGAVHGLKEAIALLQACPPVKFDQSVDVAFKLGVDSRKSDQNVRGTVSLPSGTGKKKKVLVLARADKLNEARAAGADYVGGDDLIEKIREGWTDFDVLITTPDLMRDVGKLGKVLGPRGLMPSPKAGTVTQDVAKAVQEVKGGKVEFKTDRYGIVNLSVGKLSFSVDALLANFHAISQALVRAKPATTKGHYVQSVYISSTMGPGLKIDLRELELAA